ncbi:hypothetical protein H9638_03450 [Arthrobacter sp. Sa2BUA2]|uniref:Uncharacterized protein n=1 Tax=Arthrobacter pullicola TaxID=2762224 RepID=A0ABR8YFG1_9MICC|nr:hypothetical protein [Arthrobacter pullicola]MBD8042863.1 hypothetical protein [Arthrobacter pullicola]
MSAEDRDSVTMLDAGSIVLVVAGALCATLFSLPPRSQLAQATPLLFGFAHTVRVIVDRQAAARQETVRTVKPKGKRLGSAAWLGAVIVPVLHFSAVPGHGWLALGYLFVGLGLGTSSLVESRKTDQEDPVDNDP